MRHSPQRARRWRRRPALQADTLESRALLSAAPHGLHDISIEVPSVYVSQQASAIDVTLVRKGSAASIARNALSVDLSAQSNASSGQNSAQSGTAAAVSVDEALTLAAGERTLTVAIPINPQAPSSGLTPVQITVSEPQHPAKGTSAIVELASGPDDVPPIITGAHLVKNGLAITFSKPMAPATVENLHNYVVMYVLPSQYDPFVQYAASGIVQELALAPTRVHFRGAKYDAATDTVTLLMHSTPGTLGTYRIGSPPSLAAKLNRPDKAHALTDAEGNPLLASGSHVPGSFSFSIYRGHPYAASAPTFSDGS
jgi:hypothetical protein